MSKDLNQCNFIGRLGKDVEFRSTPSGTSVANFSIACGDDYKKDGAKVEQTNWINITAFGRLAEICEQYLEKGRQVFVSGKQVTEKWQDKEGKDRYTTKIIASELQMLGGRQATQQDSHSEAKSNGYQPQEDFDDTDIPFRGDI